MDFCYKNKYGEWSILPPDPLDINHMFPDDFGKELARMALNSTYGVPQFFVKDVILHDPATIILWSDGTKTVVKCQDGDTYDAEKGIALCFMKKACGNTGKYNKVFKKYVPDWNLIMELIGGPLNDRERNAWLKTYKAVGPNSRLTMDQISNIYQTFLKGEK